MKIENQFKSNFLLNRNILVTGASKGIGREIALGLSSYGANIILLSRDEEALDQLYDEITNKYQTSPLIIKCDLNDLDEIKAQEIANVISKNMNTLDGIIHNAALIGKMSSIIDFDLKTWNKVINTNLTSSYLLSKFLIPLMYESKNPRIIFTSSGIVKRGRAFWGAYSVSKSAVKSLAEILEDEVEPISNIKVFNFDPGATRTSMRAFAYPCLLYTSPSPRD